MIDYVEIRDKDSREVIGIIDTATSIIWKTVYYGVGDFEIYVSAESATVALLQIGNLVTRQDDINCGIIQRVEITDDTKDGRMIVASGQFAKSIIGRRIIYKWESTYFMRPTVIRGNVAEAAWSLINQNCVTNTNKARNFLKFGRGTVNYLPQIIVDENGAADEKQVTYDNLLEYTDALLQEYGIGAYVWLDEQSLDFLYVMYQGVDRSRDNTAGNEPIIFSTDFDNLSETNYSIDDSGYKNMAIIGGEDLTIQEKTETQAEIKKRFVTRHGDTISGYARREVFVDASSIKKSEKNDADEDIVIPDADYSKLLIQNGRQRLQDMQIVETFDGSLDLTNSTSKYRVHFNIGDIITVEDMTIGKYINARILTVTEVQDKDGYKIDLKYGN